MDLLQRTYLGNSLERWSYAAAITVLIVFVVHLTTTVLRRRIKKVAQRTSTGVDDLIVDVISATRLSLTTVVALWAGARMLALSPHRVAQLELAAMVCVFVQGGIWVSAAIRGTAERVRRRRVAAGELASVSVIGMMGLLTRVAAWVIVLLLILDNLGINITALVAGLGIGGIAIALAAQNILGDLFASISIIFDKPFTVGDAIAVGDLSGTVDQIGLKTTRLRSTTGEELILPNGDLLSSRIRNYKRMQERRVQLVLGVTYDTPREVLAGLPEVIRAAVSAEEKVRFDRAHFRGFGASALELELIYFVTTPDYVAYMDAQQRINLRLLEALETRKVQLAFPTQSIHLHRADADLVPAPGDAGDRPASSRA
jgi:small-conductance mechanosensitive channel